MAFYRDVVGCKVGAKANFGTPGVDAVVCVSMHTGKGELELMEILDTPSKYRQRPLEEDEVGSVHIAFNVDDIHEHVQKVKDSGAEITAGLYDLKLANGVVIDNFYFRDPDGYTLQFS
ncbi:MAG: VOC family protein, partial [Candidatus Hydrogenedentes bacterium]|nr:VOC family protein [Candidatus Hydrogenedentota bacterium]